MRKENIIKIIGLILFVIYSQTASSTEIKTTLDRNPVNINESFQIIFTASESPDGDPDFSPLAQDFDILNKSQQNKSSWINGQSSKTIQWIITTMAKRSGSLSIPSIPFGKDNSQPISLRVNKNISSNQNIQTNKELLLDVNVSSTTPYVQAQVIYTLRFYRKVQIAQASLNEPELDDAIIEKLGEDKSYNTELNGVTYLVTERKYAIFPQKSGTQTIPPLVLNASIISNSRSRFNGFFNSTNTTTKRVTSKEIILDVQAAPKDFNGKRWIPAEQVHIEEKWSGDINTIKTGEPLTRTLTILIKGTTPAQLPELHSDIATPQLKTYPDQPVLKEQKNEDGLIALREEKIAYIPSETGNYTLPSIEVPWFNTQTRKMEIARIPETTITAISSGKTQTNTPPQLTLTQLETVKSESITHKAESYFWLWVSAFLACGWLLTLWFFIKQSRTKPEIPPISSDQITLKKISRAIKQACGDNNPTAAKNALLNWGRIKFNETNLSATAYHCPPTLRDEIFLLNQILYARHPKPWKGNSLLQAFEASNTQKTNTAENDKLEPLYNI